ncbi:nucleotide-diphospho-sugar transferase [Polychytrium aggregatum]|uniref:nucleotide-diphospho-sugar transferase n=1 Tax=Polychytrium aggregatum TaxID=110093 RepID=UPI0022FE6B16|nr:nucleotide-diphospho-sugar transferase [Polychytrium aggregatum]KAI9203438.1 nucleotide-diphospho-sugar transferase [Polychytrium aggregatum]
MVNKSTIYVVAILLTLLGATYYVANTMDSHIHDLKVKTDELIRLPVSASVDSLFKDFLKLKDDDYERISKLLDDHGASEHDMMEDHIKTVLAEIREMKGALSEITSGKVASKESSERSTKQAKPPKKNAYGFYVTNDEYACAALIMVRTLLNTGLRPGVEIFVLVTSDVSEKYIRKMRKMGMVVKPTTRLEVTAIGDTPTWWKQSMTKMNIFNMTEYDRIIFLDADGFVLKNMDSLFDLPPYFLYSPRATYVTDKQPWMNAQMYIINPAQWIYDKQIHVFEEYESRGEVMYDMDITNVVFRHSAAILPGYYVVLNGVLMEPPGTHIGLIEGFTVEDVIREAFVVHFVEKHTGGYGKPWHDDRTFKDRPKAYPIAHDIFRKWWAYQDEYCFSDY